jgi:nucleoside-diphosphate-sugar epimerase
MKVLITGGSGMLGSAITKKLISENISVVHLTRNKSSKHDIKNYEWDWEKNKIDNTCFEGVTDIIHLSWCWYCRKTVDNQKKKRNSKK